MDMQRTKDLRLTVNRLKPGSEFYYVQTIHTAGCQRGVQKLQLTAICGVAQLFEQSGSIGTSSTKCLG